MRSSLTLQKLKERQYQLQTSGVGGTQAGQIVLNASLMVSSVDSPCINGAKIKNKTKNQAVKESSNTSIQSQTEAIHVIGIPKELTVLGASPGRYNAEKAKQQNVEASAKNPRTWHATECPPHAKIFQNVGLEPLATRRLKNANVARECWGMATSALIKKLEKQLPTQVAMLIFQSSLQASSLFSPMVAQSSQFLSKIMTNHPTNLTCF